MSNGLNRRRFLGIAGASVLGLPALFRPARAQIEPARRLIVFYFPDGVAGPSADGEPSLWATRAGAPLPDQLAALTPHRDACLFLNGLSMGGTDEGSHPGGARKLLTGADGGGGRSLDRVLAQTVGADRPHRHVYLGAMANWNGASGDKHISYPEAGFTTPPWDDPVEAFERLFAGQVGPAGPDPAAERRRRLRLSLLDGIRGELADLKAGLGPGERARIDLHVEAVREVEQRIQGMAVERDPEACGQGPEGIDRGQLYAPEQFPAVLAAQTELLVQAMACGLTRVGVIQASHHTSELIMSRFAGTEMYDPGFDMRSHQASHYGPRHDFNRREFHDYFAQRRWFVQQYARVLDALAARPEGDGTMLDYSLVLLCSEVSDGNTHAHRDMPFILGGRGAGRVRAGQVLQADGARHAGLLAAIGQAMGADLPRFGDTGSEALPGVLT
ncbi:MAG: DUF1552 domain-containing protein [bacterium]